MKTQNGFTLIELLIVMVILGLLAALVAPQLIGHTGKAEQKAAKSQISLFETALDTYRLDVGRYPTAQQGLDALWKKPEGVARWNGPYLKKEVPSDPWGNPYSYKFPGDHGEFDIMSLGSDGKAGGDGDATDICSWKDIGK